MKVDDDRSLSNPDEDWLDQLLLSDATGSEHASNAAFSAAVMASLPSAGARDYSSVARFALSGLASAAAAIVVIEKGPQLMGHFADALAHLQPAAMITSAAPFAVLLGMVLFTYRQQQDS